MTKSIVSALCLAALAAAVPLGAQPAMPKPGSKSIAGISAGTYKVDSWHTLVTWRVDHMGLTPYTGIFGDVTGTLELDPKRPAAAKVDVTIPVAKVTTASAALTAHLLRAPKDADGKPDFFGADPAPAHFVSTGVKLLGKDHAAISGTLTLNGVTKPVVLDTVFYGAGKMPAMMGGGDGVGFTARATIKRSEFGLGFGVPMVSDAVALDIAAGFMK